ncbi:hypothetical protein KIW84_044189 [Lathyrus oleraceus]|uniref:Uncharacterized protein n=1 Tax=Pisum sativum TaxID=3888 RepID=A0A9D4XK11_PEA|nr:hypothetical protein KIW84_044189 [Pisum sativum]
MVELHRVSMNLNVTLIFSRSFGVTGFIRISLKEHVAPEHFLDDLRLNGSWLELKIRRGVRPERARSHPTQLLESPVVEFDRVCMNVNVTLIFSRSFGVTGFIRISLKEHVAPEHFLDDLRLNGSWLELKIHRGVRPERARSHPTQLLESPMVELDRVCMNVNVILIFSHSFGLTGFIRISLKEHVAPEHFLDDLRLNGSWLELKIHIGVRPERAVPDNASF